ncbi:MAG: flagellar hook protein FlgE [Planctomycetota bacterium]|jgi:flagellar hook protein FlgE
MSFALMAGVSGLQAHQRMLDVAGNNLANINTIGYKSSRIIFSELLAQTLKRASAPTSTIGGINPQQIGSGVQVGGITPDTSQGNLIRTNSPLDLAIEGEGYFVLSDGSRNVYSRAGAFAVDAGSNLVDPSTGYIVQRIGTVGESDGFQTPGDTNTKVPYDVAMPASATSEIKVAGNLSADAMLETAQTNVLRSDTAYTTSGNSALGGTLISDLDQFSGAFGAVDTDGKLYVTGIAPDGTAITDAVGLDVGAATTLNDVLAYIETQYGAANVTASISNGRIVITDDASGYSQTDISLSYTGSADGTDSVTMPGYFEIATVGGEEVKNFNIIAYDSQGGSHVLSGAFVKTDTVNLWDLVLTSISGNITDMTSDNRRIEGIEFNGSDGSFAGLNTGIGDTAQFTVSFAHDPSNPQVITVDMGTQGQYNGLTQFARSSTAVAKEQDGYQTGELSSVSVSSEGYIIGSFTNGIKKNLAAVQLALFKNPSGLESVGNGYFTSSVNSGEPIATQGLIGGAGMIHGGSLEKSNADVASLFVSMIEAQNGYHANARTIKIANDMLKELTNLIR